MCFEDLSITHGWIFSLSGATGLEEKKIGTTVAQYMTKCNKYTFHLKLHFTSFIKLRRIRSTSSFISAAGIKDPDQSYLRDERFDWVYSCRGRLFLRDVKKGPQGASHNTFMIKSKERIDIYSLSGLLFSVSFLHYCVAQGLAHEMVAPMFRVVPPHQLTWRQFFTGV